MKILTSQAERYTYKFKTPENIITVNQLMCETVRVQGVSDNNQAKTKHNNDIIGETVIPW